MSTDVHKLQQQVSKNVKVLMAISEIATQGQLAERLGWDRTVVANRFSGKRGWKLADVGELADVFGVHPGELLGDTAALVGAAGKASAVSGGSLVNGNPTHPYSLADLTAIASLPQVSVIWPDETDVARLDASERVVSRDAA